MRIIALAILGIVVYSCSPKVVAPVTPVTGSVAVELTPELAAGKNLYDHPCAKCHKYILLQNFLSNNGSLF